MKEGNLRKNSIGRWEVERQELTSGDPVELLIEGHWISGNIEFWGLSGFPHRHLEALRNSASARYFSPYNRFPAGFA